MYSRYMMLFSLARDSSAARVDDALNLEALAVGFPFFMAVDLFIGVRAGPAKKRTTVLFKVVSRLFFLKSFLVSHCKLGVGKAGSTDPGTIVYMQVPSIRGSDSISPRYRRKPQKYEVLIRRIFLPKFWHKIKPSFPIKVKFGVDSPEDTRRRSISSERHKWKRYYDKKNVPVHETYTRYQV